MTEKDSKDPGVELETSKPSGSQQSGMGTTTLPSIAKYRFDNLFVDWGDGTVVPLVGKPDDPLYNDQDKKGVNGDVAMTLPDQQEYSSYTHTVAIGNKEHAARRENFFTHQYTRTGYFNIRVYQLAERDVQQVNPGDLADAYDHPSGSAGAGAYGQLRRSGSALQAGDNDARAKDIAERAYLLGFDLDPQPLSRTVTARRTNTATRAILEDAGALRCIGGFTIEFCNRSVARLQRRQAFLQGSSAFGCNIEKGIEPPGGQFPFRVLHT